MEKKTINAKKVGNILTVVIGDQKLSKKVTKEEFELIKPEIEKFNKKNSATLEKKIVTLMSPVETKDKKAKEVAVVKAKAEKQLVKKEIKAKVKKTSEENGFNKELQELIATGEDITPERMQQLINKHKQVEQKVAPAAVATTARRGEY